MSYDDYKLASPPEYREQNEDAGPSCDKCGGPDAGRVRIAERRFALCGPCQLELPEDDTAALAVLQ